MRPTWRGGLRIAESLGRPGQRGEHALPPSPSSRANRMHLDVAGRLRAGGRVIGRPPARPPDDQGPGRGAWTGLKIAYLSLGDTGALAERCSPSSSPCCAAWGDLFLLPWAGVSKARSCSVAPPAELGSGGGCHRERPPNSIARPATPHQKAWYVAHLGWLAGTASAAAWTKPRPLGRQAGVRAGPSQHEPRAGGRPAACTMLGDTVIADGRPGPAGRLSCSSEALAAAQGRPGWRHTCCAATASAGRRHRGRGAQLERGGPGWLEAGEHPGRRRLDAGATRRICRSRRRGWRTMSRTGPARYWRRCYPSAEREPWIPALAAALAVDGRVLARAWARGEQARGRSSSELSGLAGAARAAARAARGRARPGSSSAEADLDHASPRSGQGTVAQVRRAHA